MQLRDPHLDIALLGDLVTVWAHPDDESYLAAGAMAMAVAAGARVTCVTATGGELGGPVDLQAELAWRRVEELAEALDTLGVRDRVLLGCPDGGCADIDVDEAARTLAAILADRRPDTILTFGPDGFTGHPDHRAVSAWVDAAVELLDGPKPRVLHATETPSQAAVLAGFVDPELGDLTATVSHGPEELALALDLPEDVLDRKVQALRAHRTQTAELEARIGPVLYRAWVACESFVAAPVLAKVGA